MTATGLRAGRVFDAALTLLDRQVLDVDGVPVTAVADLELTDVGEGDIPEGTAAPTIVAFLDGPILGTRIFGGRPPAAQWLRIPWKQVTAIGSAIALEVSGEQLDVTWRERWVRDHVIARIPGGCHDPE
jgi:sporulation protein YlmC with PRC-barrel domain